MISLKKLFVIGSGFAVFFVAVFFVSILSVHQIFPSISSHPYWGSFSFFHKSSENVTVINTVKETTIREDDRIPEIVMKTRNSVVSVVIKKVEPKKGNVVEIEEKIGTVVTNDGLIITSELMKITSLDQTDVSVVTADGRILVARFLGQDAYSRLAFFKVDGSDFTAVSFANSDDILPGRKLFVIGVQEEFQEQFIKSAILASRSEVFTIAESHHPTSEKLQGVLLVNGEFSHADVGSAVVNMLGECVGILGQRSVGNQTDWYVISSNTLQELQTALSDEYLSQEVEGLGIYTTPITASIRAKYAIAADHGEWVRFPLGVEEALLDNQKKLYPIKNIPRPLPVGSVAQKIGLQEGDIILAVDEQKVDVRNPLSEILWKKRNEESYTLKVLREDEEIILQKN